MDNKIRGRKPDPGLRMRQIRRERGLSLKQVADKTFYCGYAIGCAERRVRYQGDDSDERSTKFWKTMSDFYGVPVEDLRASCFPSKNIYISGPITGINPGRCEMHFNCAKRQLKRLGQFPVSPLDIGKLLPVDFEHEDYLAVDLTILKKMDACLFLEGWQNSKGCQVERQICEKYKIRIYDSIKQIKEEIAQ